MADAHRRSMAGGFNGVGAIECIVREWHLEEVPLCWLAKRREPQLIQHSTSEADWCQCLSISWT